MESRSTSKPPMLTGPQTQASTSASASASATTTVPYPHPLRKAKNQHSRYEAVELDFVLELVYKYKLSNAEVIALYKAVFPHKADETFENKQVQYIKQTHGSRSENNTPSEGQEFKKLHGKLTPSAKTLISKLTLGPENPGLRLAASKVLLSDIAPMEPNIPGFTSSDSPQILLQDSESENDSGDDEGSMETASLPPAHPAQNLLDMVPPQPGGGQTLISLGAGNGSLPLVPGYEQYGVLSYITSLIDQHHGNEFYKTNALNPAFNPCLPGSPFHGMRVQQIGFHNMVMEHYGISELSYHLYALQHSLPIHQ